jgi:hypothetical protein
MLKFYIVDPRLYIVKILCQCVHASIISWTHNRELKKKLRNCKNNKYKKCSSV